MLVNNDSLDDGTGPPPEVPPRRKHSGKMLKQQAELSASLQSNSSNYQCFSGLPPIPKVKVSAFLNINLRGKGKFKLNCSI